MRPPNIRDVAAHAGVSYQTVSRVLNDSPSIRPATRERVLLSIDALGFRPNQAARALATSRSRTIGVLSAQSSHYGPTTAIAAIEQAAREAGYGLSITTVTDASMRSGLEFLLSQGVDAIVVVAPQVPLLRAVASLSIDVPFVTLESTGDELHSLSIDQVEGARLAVRHLVALGHSRILHLAGPQDWAEAQARLEGYRLELGDAALPPVVGDWTADFGFTTGSRLLPSRDFTAVFAANDQMALGLLHAARSLGLDVPGDLSVVGFDDIPDAAHFAPPLTTVRQDFAEVGRRAIARLLAELSGSPLAPVDTVPASLVLRASTARI